MGRLLIIGLDGATFDLIKPWAQVGKLPNLEKLLADGVHGKLKSTIPPMSPPAWTSFMTGKNPGKHGVFDFTARKPNSYEIEFVNARWRRAETIWKIISDAGKRLCVLSVPMTYPPEKINGVMISGIDTPVTGGIADSTAIHPTEVYEEIATKLGGYLISPNLQMFNSNQCDEMVQASLQTVRRKMETALYLLAKDSWDCFMITIGETDGIAHRLWKYHDKHSPLADEHSSRYEGPNPILQIYQQVDQYVGKICQLMDEDTTIMVMSDHGHGGNGSKTIFLNTWLAEQGFLRFKTGVDKRILYSIVNEAKSLGIKVVPSFIKKMIFRWTQIANKMESSFRFSHIDWSHTKAYSEETPYYPHIWVNVKGREPFGIVNVGEEYEEIRQDIVQKICKWIDQETENEVVKKVYKREDIYCGPFVEKFPDLIVEWNLDANYSYLFKRSIGGKKEKTPIRQLHELEKKNSKSGDHRDNGIFIASGKPIKQQAELGTASIMDIAPTILYLLGVPVPSDMDGQVLHQIFTEKYLQSHIIQYKDGSSSSSNQDIEPIYGYSEREENTIKERLQGLGYIE